MQLVSEKMAFQPPSIDDLHEDKLSEDEAYHEEFNKGTKKIVALYWGDRCSKCGNKKRLANAFWYLCERLCSVCISDWFISDQVISNFTCNCLFVSHIPVNRSWSTSMGSP